MEATGVPDWSSLPRDLLAKIAAHVLLSSGDDFMAFRRVCTFWREAATKDIFVANFTKPWPSLPYLMLAEKEGSDEREFYNLFTQKVCGKLSLPEASGRRCFEVRFGWLLTLALSDEVELLNPISHSRIKLPNLKTFPEPAYGFIERSALSANPSVTSDFVLMVSTFNCLGFWKNGAETWNRMESVICPEDMMYYNQDHKFYSLCQEGYIYTWDPMIPGGLNEPEKIFGVNKFTIGIHSGEVKSYLVESSKGELLIVVRNGFTYARTRGGASKFKVFRIDVKRKTYEETKSLENDAIFVGENASFSVPASGLPDVVKSNCIYFTDDSIESYFDPDEGGDDDDDDDDDEGEIEGVRVRQRCQIEEEAWKHDRDYDKWVWEHSNIKCSKLGGGRNMGIYNLEDGSIKRLGESAETFSRVCPPLWIVLSSLFPLH